MTALPVFDFARDIGIDYARDSALSNARAKARPDDARDRIAPGDPREDRFSDFDRALRDQDHDEPSPSRAERAHDRVNERPKALAANDVARSEEPAPAAESPLEDSNASARPDASRPRPAAKQPEAQASAQSNLILPEVVQVVSVAASNSAVSGADAAPVSASAVQSEGAEALAAAGSGAAPLVIASDTAPQGAAQNLLTGSAGAVPAPQQTPPAADAGAAPLATLNGAQADVKTGAPVQTSAQASNQAPVAQPGFVTPPNAGLQAAAAANAAPHAKLRQSSEQSAKPAEAPAASAATAQAAAQPVAALQGALKAAAAQGPKDAQAAGVQIAEVKTGAPTAQPSAFAAQLDAQSTQQTTHASAAPGHASPNSTAIAHNVVRFFRETGAGNARFDIRLDPVELGRVDARVEINHDKTVTLTLSAERPETLAELMRTARDLERQLADSGVKLSEDGLKFRLNSDARGDAQQNTQNGAEGRRPARAAYGAGADPALQAEAAIPIRSWRASGVDVWA